MAIDPDALVTQPDEGSGEAAVPAGTEGSAEAPGSYVEIDGEHVPVELVREALESHTTRTHWEATHKQRDQREAAVRRVLEGAFGKRVHELDDTDLADLQGFGSLNRRLRTDDNFARAWTETLTQMYQRSGLPRGEAKAAAARKVEEIKEGVPARETAPAVDPRLQRLEDIVLNERLDRFADGMDASIGTILSRVAPEMKQMHGHLRSVVLHGLSGYSDNEIVEMHASGELNRLLWGLARSATKATKAEIDRALKVRADAAASGGKSAATVPLKGGTVTAPAPKEFTATRGRGLRDLTDRMRETLVLPGQE